MIKLYTVISTEIKKAHDNVYFLKVPEQEKEVFPHIVYKMPNSEDFELREDFILEVDIWDDRTDVTRLEELAVDVDNVLSRFTYLDNDFFARVIRINRLILDDDVNQVSRRQLRYLVKLYLSGSLLPT